MFLTFFLTNFIDVPNLWHRKSMLERIVQNIKTSRDISTSAGVQILIFNLFLYNGARFVDLLRGGLRLFFGCFAERFAFLALIRLPHFAHVIVIGFDVLNGSVAETMHDEVALLLRKTIWKL